MSRHPIDKARARKQARAERLSALADGQVTIVAVLHEPGPLAGVELYDLLMKCPTLGRESVRRVFERSRLWPHLMVEELTAVQREALVSALPTRLQERSPGQA